MESDTNSKTVNIEKVLETECLHCHQLVDVSELATFDDIECPHCGKAMQVPGKLGNFTLLNVVGKGGMGSVYCARDEVLGRLVAIKVILPSLAQDKEFISSFKREAQAAAKVNHSHIAQIYAFGEENGQPYIVMELVTGRGLDQLIDSGKVLDQGLIMKVGMDIAEGLREADEMGLIHGDIKPENILLDEKMNGKLIDFGISSIGGVDAADGIWGTPYYIAPEKLRREKADARSDIYCLGATLYHALSGVPPFEGETPAEVVKARLEAEPLPLREVRADIDEEIERIIIRMLKTEPSQRYPTYASLLSDMHKVVDVLKPTMKRSIKSKKIVIRKRGVVVGSSSKSQPSTARPQVDTGAPKSVKKKEVKSPVALSKEEKKNRRRILLKVFGVLLLLIAVAGAGTAAFYYKMQNDEDIRIRRIEYNLNKAIVDLQEANVNVQLSVSNLVKRSAITNNLIEKVLSIVTVVTEEPADDLLSLLVLPPEPEPIIENEGGGNSVPENVDESAVTNDVQDVAEPEVVDAEPEVVDEEPEIENDDLPIIVLAKKAFALILKIRLEVRDAGIIGTESDQLTETAVNARVQKELESVLISMEDRESQLESSKEKIAKIAKKVDVVIVEMDTLRGNIEAERAEELQAKLDEEKRRLKEEAEQRKIASHEKDVADELEQVENLGADISIKKAIRVHFYDDLVDDLTREMDQLKTDEGKEAISVYVARAIYLRDLKKFLVDQLNATPFRWGWIDSGSQEDILSATQEEVMLKGRSVKWEDVSTKQFLRIINNYVTDMNKSVKLVDLGRYSMGVAVFCHEHDAHDAAERYAQKAAEMSSRFTRDIERLFPEVEDDSEEF